MDNEDIRPPDQVKTDKLFDDDFYSIYNEGIDDLNTAIEMSKNEYNLLRTICGNRSWYKSIIYFL
jgi:hypothetical protein